MQAEHTEYRIIVRARQNATDSNILDKAIWSDDFLNSFV